MADSILNKPPELNYNEPAAATDFAAFEAVVSSRRSTRIYLETKIPDEVVQKCLDMALLAPSSSNLQPAEFYWIKSESIKRQIDVACLDQPAAKTAPTLIVCVARTDTWRRNRQMMLDRFSQEQNVPASALAYYKKLIPFLMAQGPLSIFGFIKRIVVMVLGIWRPVPRGPFGSGDVKIWAIKSSALACQNLMLAFRAAGYDTCPMEGFDEVRVKKTLKLPRGAHVTMVISAGKRNSQKGIYGPQVRFSKELFVKEI
jgi:nitroreductase